MSDDLNKLRSERRSRIDVDEEYELGEWAHNFGVSEEELRTAVSSSSRRDRAAAVERYLRSRRFP
jgi:hypothetical protein